MLERLFPFFLLSSRSDQFEELPLHFSLNLLKTSRDCSLDNDKVSYLYVFPLCSTFANVYIFFFNVCCRCDQMECALWEIYCDS